MEDQNNNKSLKQNIYFIICHYCKESKNANEVINCTDEDCKEAFCDKCIKIIFSNNFVDLKKECEENGWICFKCRKLCQCHSCSDLCNKSNEDFSKIENYNYDNFSINYPFFNDFENKDKKKIIQKNPEINVKNNEIVKIKNSPINIYDFLNDKKYTYKKKINNDKKKELNNEVLNEKIEIKEEEKEKENKCVKYSCCNSKGDASLIESLCKGYKPKLNPKEMKFPFIPSQNKIPSRLKTKLIKIAKLCEHYYRHKCKCEYFKKNCLICNKPEHHTNELIRFKNSDDFICYLRYLYLCMNDVVDYIPTIFNQNKEEFLEFFRDYDKGTVNWCFKNPKILCKLCVFEIVNRINSLNTFKFYLDDNYVPVICENEYDKKTGNQISKKNDNTDNDYQNNSFINCTNKNKINSNTKNNTIEGNKNKIFEEKVPLFVDPQKTYEHLENIIYSLFTNIYKFVLIIYSLNENRISRYCSFTNQDYKVYYENFIQLKQEIENNLKSFSEFQNNHQFKINDFIGYVYNNYPKVTSFNFMSTLLTMKIENINYSHQISETVQKFINNSYKYIDEIAKLSNI